MKKIAVLLIVVCLSVSAFAQQITKFAVVDTARIYTTFPRDSRQARSYEEKREKYNSEIKRMSNEIQVLRQKKVNAKAANQGELVKKYENEIASKTSFLIEYTQSSNDELQMLSKKLISDDEFYSLLYKTIKQIAESEGYSMVLSLQETGSILWFSPSVDITDQIIRELSSTQ